jgi:hypothetical protein
MCTGALTGRFWVVFDYPANGNWSLARIIEVLLYIYRVSQELRSLLRKSFPYVKIYRYNPKHLYPKFNGYGDNGTRKVWAYVESTYCTPSVTPYSSTAHARQRDITVHCSQRKVAVTSKDNISCGLRKVLGNLRTYDNNARVFVFSLLALCHSRVTLMLSTDINITETTYSCQFQYVLGKQ